MIVLLVVLASVSLNSRLTLFKLLSKSEGETERVKIVREPKRRQEIEGAGGEDFSSG